MGTFRTSINQYELDKEWASHPKMMEDCCRAGADARLAFDEAKDLLELEHAKLYSAISSDPARYGLPKATDAVVSAAVLQQKSYQQLQASVRELRHAMQVMDAGKSALEHRKKALEDLVALHLSGYFAAPQAAKADREAVEEMEKRTIRERTRSRRRREAV